MAGALAFHNAQGFRQIEQKSGITDDTILTVLPEAGAGTVLLSCSNRGQFAFDETERRVMTLHVRRYRTSVGHPRVSLSSNSRVQEDRNLKNPKNPKDLERETQGVRQMSGISKAALRALDPSLDIWSNTSQNGAGSHHFGDAGWVLAMVTGMKPTVFALDELSRILRVGERQVRRIIDRLAAEKYASRTKEGRRVLVTVDFSYLTTEEGQNDYLKANRLARKAKTHGHEQSTLKRLGSKLGRDVRDMWKRRVVEARMLQDWAEYTGSRCWDPMIKILTSPYYENRRWEAEDRLAQILSPA